MNTACCNVLCVRLRSSQKWTLVDGQESCLFHVGANRCLSVYWQHRICITSNLAGPLSVNKIGWKDSDTFVVSQCRYC